MLQNTFFFNLSFYIALFYFCFYSFVVFGFCLVFLKWLKTASNLSELLTKLHYSKHNLFLFLFLIFSAMGVPPCVLFIPKFAGLSIVYFQSSWFFFAYALLLTFLSFALYLQLFDGLFAKRKNHYLRNYIKKIEVAPRSVLDYKIKTFSVFIFFVLNFTIFFLKT